jgi:hypothetical protein
MHQSFNYIGDTLRAFVCDSRHVWKIDVVLLQICAYSLFDTERRVDRA